MKELGIGVRDMVEELRFHLMVVTMKDIGKMTYPISKESWCTPTEKYM